MKPTYGRISRYGLIAYASSFDQIGTFTNSVEDAQLLLSIMAGTDEFDATSSTKELKFEDADYSKKYRIGIIKECFDHSGLDEEIRSHLQKIIQDLKLKGHEIIDLSFPFIEYLVPTYYVLTTA